MNKAQMERIWNARGVEQMNALAAWQTYYREISAAGTLKHTSAGEAALAFRRKYEGGRDIPKWKDKPAGGWPLEPSAELKARYKDECPNNWRPLLAAFGKTLTKYDAVEQPIPLLQYARRNEEPEHARGRVVDWIYQADAARKHPQYMINQIVRT